MRRAPALALALGLLAPPPSALASAPARLLADLNVTIGDGPRGAVQGPLRAWRDKILFRGRDPYSDLEVWSCDAALGRAESLGDLHGEPPLGSPYLLPTTPNFGFFMTGGGDFGQSLWQTDGSRAGTVRVMGGNAAPYPLVDPFTWPTSVLGNRILFHARTDPGELELWSSDGQAPPQRLAQLSAAGAELLPVQLVVGKSRAFFLVEDRPASQIVLWSTDGTAAGTHAFATLTVSDFTGRLWFATDSRVFFSAATNAGKELWTSDGTAAGTFPLTHFAPADPRLAGLAKGTGNRIYFRADDGTHGIELWRSDGTLEGTIRLTDFELPDPSGSSGWGYPVELGDKVLFFAADRTSPRRLWSNTGSPASTRLVAEVCGAICEGMAYARLVPVAGRVVFAARDSAHGIEPWASDGTAAGTRRLADLCPGTCGSIAQSDANDVGWRPIMAGGRVYFQATVGAQQVDLIQTNGTVRGTQRLTHFAAPYPFGDNSLDLVAAGGSVWFVANEPVDGQQLWRSDGALGTTRVATGIDRGNGDSLPSALGSLAGRFLFQACDGTSTWLWATDPFGPPTALAELGPGCLGPTRDAITVGGRIFFLVDGAGSGRILWSSDGTVAGTRSFAPPAGVRFSQTLAARPPGAALIGYDSSSPVRCAVWATNSSLTAVERLFDLPQDGSDIGWSFAAAGAIYYLAASSPAPTEALWRADLAAGTAQQLAALPDTFHPNEDPLFTIWGTRTLFTVGNGAVWQTDGTAAGTGPLIDPAPDEDDPILELFPVGDSLYLVERAANYETRLWRYVHGALPQLLSPIVFQPSVPGNRSRGQIGALGEGVAFAARTAAAGTEPWVSDGTPAGTHLLYDLASGPESSNPTGFFAAGSQLFFSARDVAHGRELWASDGTSVGTRLVEDLAPGAIASQPEPLSATGSTLYFAADDALSGRELWALPLDAPSACVASDTVLCLGEGRFQVEAVWRDFAGRTGVGHAGNLTGDTGTFWFFSPGNIEVILKILDGRLLNGHQWVFYGALSSVEYTLTITDTQTGAARRYFNPLGQLASVGDVEAFGPRGASASHPVTWVLARPSLAAEVGGRRTARAASKAACAPTPTRLCLAGGRFALEVAWKDFAGRTGVGTANALSADTGDFWFFSQQNIELVVKILDGRPVNGKFWLFYGALSSVEYTLTVTDTVTGVVRSYRNPAGRLASVADTRAF